MISYKVFMSGIFLGLALVFSGCGPSKAEREARDRARLDLEEQSRGEADRANKAITGMNQKLGRKPPDLNLGVPMEKTKSIEVPERKP